MSTATVSYLVKNKLLEVSKLNGNCEKKRKNKTQRSLQESELSWALGAKLLVVPVTSRVSIKCQICKDVGVNIPSSDDSEVLHII